MKKWEDFASEGLADGETFSDFVAKDMNKKFGNGVFADAVAAKEKKSKNVASAAEKSKLSKRSAMKKNFRASKKHVSSQPNPYDLPMPSAKSPSVKEKPTRVPEEKPPPHLQHLNLQEIERRRMFYFQLEVALSAIVGTLSLSTMFVLGFWMRRLLFVAVVLAVYAVGRYSKMYSEFVCLYLVANLWILFENKTDFGFVSRTAGVMAVAAVYIYARVQLLERLPMPSWLARFLPNY